MKKHAYLIMVHKFDEVFEKALRLYDDERNDIFVHVDKKVRLFPFEKIENCCVKSKVYFVDRVRVSWGGHSQIWAELSLLKKAVNTGKYEYYHLLSGSDLPLKNQDVIHNFFDIHNGKEFIRFTADKFGYEERVRYYHLLINLYGRDRSGLKKLLWIGEKVSLLIQKILHIKRHRTVQFQKGSNWFSITDDFARYIVSKEKWIRKIFKYTSCADEIFVQTLCVNSPYIDRLYRKETDNNCHGNMRLVIWDNILCPNLYLNSKVEKIIKETDLLFGRKFDVDVDKGVVEMVVDMVKK